MFHKASTALTLIDKLIPEVKCLNPESTYIHSLSDSPTSQYRNKGFFHAVANHARTYGVAATWTQWKASHGKGQLKREKLPFKNLIFTSGNIRYTAQ